MGMGEFGGGGDWKRSGVESDPPRHDPGVGLNSAAEGDTQTTLGSISSLLRIISDTQEHLCGVWFGQTSARQINPPL